MIFRKIAYRLNLMPRVCALHLMYLNITLLYSWVCKYLVEGHLVRHFSLKITKWKNPETGKWR